MKIDIDWYNDERRILIYRFLENWTVKGLEEALATAELMGDDVPDYIIFEMTHSPYVPNDFLNIRHAVSEYKHEQVKVRVIVGASNMLTVVYRALRYIFPSVASTMVFVATFDEAIDLIQNHETYALKPQTGV